MDNSVGAKVAATQVDDAESRARQNHHTHGGGVIDGPGRRGAATVDFVLRLLAFALLVSSVAVVATSDQKKMIGSDEDGWIALQAKFTYSSAIIYFVVAATIGAAYCMLTGVVSVLTKAAPAAPKLWFCLTFLDSVVAGVVASATGAITSVAYVGLKGNDHIGWQKVCDIFGKFCRHIGTGIVLAVAATTVLLLLVAMSLRFLHRRLTSTKY